MSSYYRHHVEQQERTEPSLVRHKAAQPGDIVRKMMMVMAANDSESDGIWILSKNLPPEIRENLKSTEIQLPPPCKNEKIGPRALISQMDQCRLEVVL